MCSAALDSAVSKTLGRAMSERRKAAMPSSAIKLNKNLQGPPV